MAATKFDGLRERVQANRASGLSVLFSSNVTRPDTNSILLAEPRKEVGGGVSQPRNDENVGGGNPVWDKAACITKRKAHNRASRISVKYVASHQVGGHILRVHA